MDNKKSLPQHKSEYEEDMVEELEEEEEQVEGDGDNESDQESFESDKESFVDLTPPDYEHGNRSPNWPYPIEENDRIVAAEFAIFPEYLAYVRATSNNPLVRRGAKRMPNTWLPVATADEPDPWGLPQYERSQGLIM